MLPHILLSDYYPLMQEGDVALFRGQNLLGRLIGRGSETTYSHVGILSRHNGLIELVEFKEKKGGRTVNFDIIVEKAARYIDIYRPIPVWLKWKVYNGEVKLVHKYFDGRAVTNTMRQMTGLPYGWKRLWWIIKHKMFGLRLLYNVNNLMVDTLEDMVYPVCSTAVAYSFNKNGFDILCNRADAWTEPGQIAMSPRLTGLFTITT
jgi:hypothetical protein